MKILAINNGGAGYADHMEIEAGTTVQKLFSQMVPSGRA